MARKPCACGCGKSVYDIGKPQYLVSESGCWEWQRSKDRRGYGVMNGGGGRVFAHRHFYEGMVKPVPVGMELDHLCGNPSCVNPSHLEPVTHQENVRRGGSTKLDAESVCEMKMLLLAGKHSLRQLADIYGISRHHVWMIKSGRVWSSAIPE